MSYRGRRFRNFIVNSAGLIVEPLEPVQISAAEAAYYLGEAVNYGFPPKKEMPPVTRSSKVPTSTGGRASNVEQEAAPIYMSIPHKVGKQFIKQKHHNKVHVSKVMRKQVDLIINEKKIHGHFHQYKSGIGLIRQLANGYKTYYPAGGLGQIIQSGSGTGEIQGVTSPSWLFTPVMFLHVASVLFNNKTPYNWNMQAEDPSVAANFPTSSLSDQRLKLTVKSAHMTYRYKNLQAQACRLEFFICRPRRKSAFSVLSFYPFGQAYVGGSLAGVAAGTTQLFKASDYSKVASDSGSLLDPLGYLVAAATTDVQGNSAVSVSGTVPTLVQVGLSTQTPVYAQCSIGLDPLVFPSFRAGYAFERINVTLQPGQEYSIIVEGPKDMELDSAHWFAGGEFQNLQMYCRSVMVSILDEMSTSTLGESNQGGHDVAGTDAFPYSGVAVEATLHVKMSMPEAAGGSGVNDLNYRRPHYVYVDDQLDTASTAGVVFNPESGVTGSAR